MDMNGVFCAMKYPHFLTSFFNKFLNVYFFHKLQDSGLYKNLLQEMAQKRGLGLPAYSTSQSGEVHVPFFVSLVKIGEETFEGERLRTKKQAEMSAAKVAYITLKEGKGFITHWQYYIC